MKKHLTAILLAMLIICSMILGACGGDDGDETTVPDRVVSQRTTNGVHDYTATERDDYFILNGSSEYVIVAPALDTIGEKTNLAVQEFNFFLNEATGITLSVINEDSASTTFTHNDTQKYVSIGQTKLLESAGLEADFEELGVGGLRIKTIDNNVYLYGAYDSANAYAVYDFMTIMFNYELYSTDYFEIDKVSSVKMRDFNVVDIPDTHSRDLNYTMFDDWHHVNYTRFRLGDMMCIPIGDTEYGKELVSYHNVLDVVTLDNPNAKSEWISDVGTQLCYTAHGDPESYTLMVKHVAQIIKNSLIIYKDYDNSLYSFVTLTCEDGAGGVCLCTGCLEARNKYGSNAGAVINFCNDVMTNIEAWWELPANTDYKRENFYLAFFAYEDLSACPATLNKQTGKYELNGGLTMHEHVGAWVCTDKINPSYSIYHPRNDEARENVAAWMDVASIVRLWMYDNNFSFDVSFWDTYGHYNTEGYNFYLSCRPRDVFIETSIGGIVTSFTSLKLYLQSKMLWDCSLDSKALIEKWFSVTFGAASASMKELFNSERMFEYSLYDKINKLNEPSFLVGAASNPANYSVTVVKEWLSIINEAYRINEQFNKENFPEDYARIKQNIDREYIYPAYIMLSMYSQTEAGEAYTDVIKYLKANDAYFGGGKNELSELADTWRNFVITD